MAVIYLALGSNVGDSQTYIEKTIELLTKSVDNIVRAPIYITKAVGYTDQADFLNAAVRGETSLSPQELLNFVKAIERHVGRVQRFQWGPREIDVDIIFYDREILNIPGLTIPHPRFRERDFVLRPISDINPAFIDPVTGKSVQELLESLPKSDLSIKKIMNKK